MLQYSNSVVYTVKSDRNCGVTNGLLVTVTSGKSPLSLLVSIVLSPTALQMQKNASRCPVALARLLIWCTHKYHTTETSRQTNISTLLGVSQCLVEISRCDRVTSTHRVKMPFGCLSDVISPLGCCLHISFWSHCHSHSCVFSPCRYIWWLYCWIVRMSWFYWSFFTF